MNAKTSRFSASLALAAVAVVGLTGCEDTFDDFFATTKATAPLPK